MKCIAAVFALLFLHGNTVCGQRTLTKQEILRYWNSPSERKMRNSLDIVDSDEGVNAWLIKLVDSLKANNIDSVIVFSTAFPGYISNSTCNT